jgi:hypothetical protein
MTPQERKQALRDALRAAHKDARQDCIERHIDRNASGWERLDEYELEAYGQGYIDGMEDVK